MTNHKKHQACEDDPITAEQYLQDHFLKNNKIDIIDDTLNKVQTRDKANNTQNPYLIMKQTLPICERHSDIDKLAIRGAMTFRTFKQTESGERKTSTD